MKSLTNILLIALLASANSAFAAAVISGERLSVTTRLIAPGKRVFLASDLQRWDTGRTPMTEKQPGFYVVDLPLPWADSIQYKFVVDGQWLQDFENTDAVSDGNGGMNSRLRLPGLPSFDELRPLPNGPRWIRSQFNLTDRHGRARKITLFSPPADLLLPGRRVISIYALDGGDYETQTGLQHLIAHRSRSLDNPLYRLVLIEAGDRLSEYFLSDEYADWIHDEVITAVERETQTIERSADRVMIGASLGGLAAIFHASRWPEDFSRIIAESPSLQLLNATQFRTLKNALTANSGNVEFNLTAGVYETIQLYDRSQEFYRDLNQHLRQVTFTGYPCQHQWSCWNLQLIDLFR